MEKQEYDSSKQAAIAVHMEAIMLLSGKKQVSILTANTDAEMLSELRRILFLRFEEDTYAPKTHRVVAIMAADREPGDAAKAIEDALAGNPDASRVFDAVAEAFGRRKDGDHIDMNITVNNDRVSIEHYQPPREGETVLGTLKTFTPGQAISAVATDLNPRPFAAFSLEQQVFIKYGKQLAGPATVTGITHYLDAETQYLVSYITKGGDPQSIWSAEGGLLAARGEDGPAVAPAHQQV